MRAKGLHSSKSNPLALPKQVKVKFNAAPNSDGAKAAKLLQQANASVNSLQGKPGL